MKNIFLLVLLSVLSQGVVAQGYANKFGVVYVRADANGYGIVNFDSPLEDAPASCINGHPSHMSFDTNTAGGKALMSVLLTAYSSGKKITARGTGACDEYNVIESMKYAWVSE